MQQPTRYLRILLTLILVSLAGGCAIGVPFHSDRPMSYLGLRWEATVRQSQDFTCGGASLATILTYYWSVPTSETMALAPLKDRYPPARLRRLSETGLSFDDLIYMANRLGFSSEGARVPLSQLSELAGPVIVHLNKGQFQHFVVLRKTGDGVYYVSDPIVGQLTMHADEFGAQYTGYALAVWKSDAGLPGRSVLMNPRDGIRVSVSLGRQIDIPNWPFHPGL
jgi:predicted double-glycine peptidase